ncbi:MmyB family transcriptional regulator [Amycolatopsis sp. NPDC005003]
MVFSLLSRNTILAGQYDTSTAAAADGVAFLHVYAGRHPDDPQLAELIGELSVRSDVSAACGPATMSSPTLPDEARDSTG